MKRNIYIISKGIVAAAMLIATTVCCGGHGTTKAEAQVANDSVTFCLEDSVVKVSIYAEQPSGPCAKAVCEWLDECLGGTFQGDDSDLQAVADYYGNHIADSLRSEANEVPTDEPLAYEARMKQEMETDKIVTYGILSYIYLGGPHPSSFYEAVTFRKSDGRRLGWDILRRHNNESDIYALIEQALMDYFQVKSREELVDNLILENTYTIPLPVTPPSFTHDGVAFIYQQYEIAPYAAGMPSGVIPYSKMKPLMAQWALNLVP